MDLQFLTVIYLIFSLVKFLWDRDVKNDYRKDINYKNVRIDELTNILLDDVLPTKDVLKIMILSRGRIEWDSYQHPNMWHVRLGDVSRTDVSLRAAWKAALAAYEYERNEVKKKEEE